MSSTTSTLRAAYRHEFVYLTGCDGIPLTGTYERFREHPGWRTHTLGTGHDAMAEAAGRVRGPPDRLVPPDATLAFAADR